MRNDARPPPDLVWLSIAHYCLTYDVTRGTVRKYLALGLLASWQVGRVLRVANVPPYALPTQNPRN
jgi:hypothetical protein